MKGAQTVGGTELGLLVGCDIQLETEAGGGVKQVWERRSAPWEGHRKPEQVWCLGERFPGPQAGGELQLGGMAAPVFQAMCWGAEASGWVRLSAVCPLSVHLS